MTSVQKMLVLVLASAISTTGALAQYYPDGRYPPVAEHYNHAARFSERGPPASPHPDWWRRWQLNRLYHQPPDYLPDDRACFPGACRDNPNY